MINKKKIAVILSTIMSACMLSSVVGTVEANAAEAAITQEYLSRGVMAVRCNNNAFISWRTLVSDKADTWFNLYRSVDGGEAVKLNATPITGASNYEDKTCNFTKNNTYYVTTINNGVESEFSTGYTLAANSPVGAIKKIPIKDGGSIKNVWVGDYNADGDYDFLVSRAQEEEQLLEAYLSDGTYLWTINLGPNSNNKNNISPGSTTIDVGNFDGATVYDIDGDGKAEVLLKIANGVTFGDRTKFTYSNDLNQWIAVVDGMTGSCKDTAPIPDDYISAGSMGASLGVGYLDGEKPSLVARLKNRNKDKSFNLTMASYSYTDGEFKMDWQWNSRDEEVEPANGHQFRIADVDYDGKDEVLEVGYCLNGDGTLRYSLMSQGIMHGDRFYVGKFNKNDDVMMGYGIQQNNPDGLREYYYNASTGEVIWKHNGEGLVDVGRGCVGDVDPTKDGLEVWSFSGIYNAESNTLLSNVGTTIWPTMSMYWDGDLLADAYHYGGVINNWNFTTKTVSRLLTAYKIQILKNDGNFEIGYGDIFGDWREEVICSNVDNNELAILTTSTPTEYRIPCLAQDRAYRNCMTLKGYKQSHIKGYYIGADRTDYSDELGR